MPRWGSGLLVVGCDVAALGLLRLGFPGGLMFGPMVVSAILHGGAFINVTMPSWLAIAAMVGLGTVSGGRFTGTPFRLMLSYLGAALGAFAVVARGRRRDRRRRHRDGASCRSPT